MKTSFSRNFATAATILLLALTVLGVCFTPTILKWMDTPADVLPQSITYFRYYFCGAIFVVMYNIFVGILHAVGDSRHPLYYLMFSTCVNVVLDLLFVGVFHLGVGAAAMATTISQGISALLCCIHLLRTTEVYRLNPGSIRFHGRSLKRIVSIGLPSGVQNSMISIANVVVQTCINGFGSAAVAGCGTGRLCLPAGGLLLPGTGHLRRSEHRCQTVRTGQKRRPVWCCQLPDPGGAHRYRRLSDGTAADPALQ